MSEQRRFWHDFYEGLYPRSEVWMDYADERMQAHTFAVALEAGGPMFGRRVLAVGCGKGRFTRCLAGLGAKTVGVDFIEAAIEEHRRVFPDSRWEAGDVLDPAFCASLGAFDRIFLLEVLQHLEPERALRNLWAQLEPGGRIVGVYPNPENPFVQRTMGQRFAGNYRPPKAREVLDVLRSLPGHATSLLRGIVWRDDPTIVPNDLTAWTSEPDWPSPPKRLQIVALKA